MRQHVSLESRLVVECFGAFAAGEHLLLVVLKGMLEQSSPIFAGTPALQTSVREQIFAMFRLNVSG